MLTYRVTQPPSDNDSLQADVMRFMAIIAFCLIAILALVKEVDPPAAASKTTESAAEPMEPQQPEPVVTMTQVADPTPIETWREPLPKPVAAVETSAPTPKPQREPRPLQLEKLNSPRPTSPKAAAAPPATTAAAEAAAADEEGLSLRFASDGDFLRLIARGDIKVYAFNNRDVLGLTDGYEFLDTHTPGKVYELLPQTIPTLIYDALTRSRKDTEDSVGFSWGITLPAKIESQISSYLTSAKSGQLVIDKYGEVHHVAQH